MDFYGNTQFQEDKETSELSKWGLQACWPEQEAVWKDDQLAPQRKWSPSSDLRVEIARQRGIQRRKSIQGKNIICESPDVVKVTGQGQSQEGSSGDLGSAR